MVGRKGVGHENEESGKVWLIIEVCDTSGKGNKSVCSLSFGSADHVFGDVPFEVKKSIESLGVGFVLNVLKLGMFLGIC